MPSAKSKKFDKLIFTSQGAFCPIMYKSRHISEKVQWHVLLMMVEISVCSIVGTNEPVVGSASG